MSSKTSSLSTHVCGVPPWSTTKRSSVAWPPRQPRNVTPMCCSFYRSRWPSTGFILVAGKLKVPADGRQELKIWFSIASRLSDAYMSVRTDAWRPLAPFGLGAVLLWMPTEWNKRDHNLLAAIRRSSLAWRVGATRHFGCLTPVDRAPPGKCAAVIKQTPPQRCSFLSSKTAAMNSIYLCRTHVVSFQFQTLIVTRGPVNNRFTAIPQSSPRERSPSFWSWLKDRHTRTVRCSFTQDTGRRLSPGEGAACANLGSARRTAELEGQGRGQPLSSTSVCPASSHPALPSSAVWLRRTQYFLRALLGADDNSEDSSTVSRNSSPDHASHGLHVTAPGSSRWQVNSFRRLSGETAWCHP